MNISEKKYPLGNVAIIVVYKIKGKINELVTIGITKFPDTLTRSGKKGGRVS